MTDSLNYAVILAGGSGTRFWPKSRHLNPKQLCKIGDSEATMIEITLGRLEGFIPPERRIIVTHKDQVEATKRVVGRRCHTIIAEPEAKNTAAALCLAALEIKQQTNNNPNAMMISLHADHVIKDVNNFLATIEKAISVASHGYLTLMGIEPQYPETGYGYIEKGEAIDTIDSAWKVKSFREKPNKELAEEYISTGNFSWNSGLFVWTVSTILNELSRHLPKTIALLTEALEACNGSFASDHSVLAKYYKQLESISIDNAILEKSSHVAMVSGDFGWQDIGSWSALDLCFETDQNNNLIYADAFTLDTTNTTIDSDHAFVATIGLKDMVIVSHKNTVLVCPKNRSQDVKKVVAYLKENNKTDFY